MSNLRQLIEQQAMVFATHIVQALRGASLDDLMKVDARFGSTSGVASTMPTPRPKVTRTEGKNGRLGRRSLDDIARTLDEIVNVLGQHPEGLRANELTSVLGLDKRELPRPLADGLKAGILTKAGRKRATTYFAKRGPAGAGPVKSGAAASKRRGRPGR